MRPGEGSSPSTRPVPPGAERLRGTRRWTVCRWDLAAGAEPARAASGVDGRHRWARPSAGDGVWSALSPLVLLTRARCGQVAPIEPEAVLFRRRAGQRRPDDPAPAGFVGEVQLDEAVRP